MKTILCLVNLSFCLLILSPLRAQTDSLEANKLILKFSPQYLLVNGLYLEVEKRVRPGSNHSILAVPTFYYGDTDYIDSNNDRDQELNDQNRVQGYGLSFQHRIYTAEGAPAGRQGLYVGYGVEYHHFKIDFERKGFVKEPDEEGLEYYKYRLRPFEEKINRMGFMAMGGVQSPFLHERVLADLSLGIGYRKSTAQSNYSEIIFNAGPTDFGYTGAYILGNLKFGFAF